jgi:O-antigen/teichoic acid export membrane protein
MGIIQKQGIANTIISYLGIAIGFVNILILQPYMLSPDEIGLTRILFSLATLFATIFPLGLNGVIVKFLPEYRDDNGNKGFLGFILLLSISFYLIFAVFFYLFKDNFFSLYYNNSKLFWEFSYFVLPISMFIGFSNLLGIYLFATFRSTIPTGINDIFVRLFSVVITSLYFLKWVNLPTFVLLFAIGFCCQTILLLYYILSKDGINAFRVTVMLANKINFKRFMLFAFSMSLMTICNMAIKNIDVLMIGRYLSLEDVAVYSIAILICSFIELPASALGKIADGKISDHFLSKEWDKIKSIYYESTKILFFIGCFLFLNINLNIVELLHFLPSKFHSGALVVNIVSLSALSNMSTGINSSMLLYTNKNKQITVLLVALVVIMFTLNLILIPQFGLKGAAMAVAITFILFNISKSVLIYYYFKMNPFGLFFIIISAITLITFFGLNNFIFFNGWIDMIFKSIIVTVIFALIILTNQSLYEEKKKLLTFFKLIK